MLIQPIEDWTFTSLHLAYSAFITLAVFCLRVRASEKRQQRPRMLCLFAHRSSVTAVFTQCPYCDRCCLICLSSPGKGMNNAVPELADNTQAYRIEKSKAEEFKTEGLQNEAMILSKLITKEEENSSIKLMNDLEKVKCECCLCFFILLPLNYCNSHTVGLKLISFFSNTKYG